VLLLKEIYDSVRLSGGGVFRYLLLLGGKRLLRWGRTGKRGTAVAVVSNVPDVLMIENFTAQLTGRIVG
jgi:hypothetical protein